MNMVSAQDSMAWATQGYVTDCTQVHIGVGDEGIIVLRKLLKEQIERVKQGLEPLGIISRPGKEPTDRPRCDQRTHRSVSHGVPGRNANESSFLRQLFALTRGHGMPYPYT
jgi:hypothetical protein